MKKKLKKGETERECGRTILPKFCSRLPPHRFRAGGMSGRRGDSPMSDGDDRGGRRDRFANERGSGGGKGGRGGPPPRQYGTDEFGRPKREGSPYGRNSPPRDMRNDLAFSSVACAHRLMLSIFRRGPRSRSPMRRPNQRSPPPRGDMRHADMRERNQGPGRRWYEECFRTPSIL